ncbi:type I-E CRISPR-associated protein Cse1/CasA [Vibrio sp. MEBiC08052]|uniref:type I-E CRISPR-associated protein Cse1/CasA n=1 Tax=Vibrio sp. MEBiC08052 TaxID=1761910 RepID=UPI0007406BB4|nr:type I-E CRISPR-associated protein Cse1/CasA [Vibrio sp. MEBiC08052]KUI98085.1 CRISPR-associated Cse1 family protein [Vibrio sp. MEBiC08052]
MNLLQQPWLPFRMRDGTEKVLALTSIGDPDVVDFALPRADFQGAAYQFTIGVLQTAFAPQDAAEWRERFRQSPSVTQLQAVFEPMAHAFDLLGDGPLFMQDLDPLDDQKPTPVSALLIEAPGANGIRHNTDHFIKRGIGDVMSLEMAALALFTMQINAPAGGVGHRVGLRGGGPLTTLVLPANSDYSLWQKLWLNVINREMWRYDDPDFHDGRLFPWLAPTRESQKKNSEIYQKDVHPLHMFWAMPRRIRLLVDQTVCQCQISGRETTLSVSQYRTKNYGGNYSGNWEHPLTPYKWDPKKPDEEHLSIKGQPGGINYKIWDVLTFDSPNLGVRCASVVKHYQSIALKAKLNELPRLWVFGYDMDNMKARGWYSVALPLFEVEHTIQDEIVSEVQRLQKLANEALWHTRTQIKQAWFERPGDIKGDTSFIDLAFWQRSETSFFIAVEQMVAQAQHGDQLAPEQAQRWLEQLQRLCLALFDEYALSAELVNQRDMAKRIKARRALQGWLYSSKDKNPVRQFINDYRMTTIQDAV